MEDEEGKQGEREEHEQGETRGHGGGERLKGELRVRSTHEEDVEVGAEGELEEGLDEGAEDRPPHYAAQKPRGATHVAAAPADPPRHDQPQSEHEQHSPQADEDARVVHESDRLVL